MENNPSKVHVCIGYVFYKQHIYVLGRLGMCAPTKQTHYMQSLHFSIVAPRCNNISM